MRPYDSDFVTPITLNDEELARFKAGLPVYDRSNKVAISEQHLGLITGHARARHMTEEAFLGLVLDWLGELSFSEVNRVLDYAEAANNDKYDDESE